MNAKDLLIEDALASEQATRLRLQRSDGEFTELVERVDHLDFEFHRLLSEMQCAIRACQAIINNAIGRKETDDNDNGC